MLDETPHPHLDDGIRELLGEPAAASLYLDRCQVDTPETLVGAVWRLIHQRRPGMVGRVLDFGAGDGRFAHSGHFTSYVGYEIDRARYAGAELPHNARMINACAFAGSVAPAQICLGNPPYVRNQDLPLGWRQSAARVIAERTGVAISGLANAWQYFFLLSLASTAPDGLVAIVIPFEWVSRPSSAALRQYIREQGWDVAVYRLPDETFADVLTTASVTIVDKRKATGAWRFYEQGTEGAYHTISSPTGNGGQLLAYVRGATAAYAKRGLSPGTQEYLTLTEAERSAHRLVVDRDVVRCLTSLRPTTGDALGFSEARFQRDYVDADQKCWLIRTDRPPTKALQAYLDSVPEAGWQTSTCLGRKVWWQFTMPEVPSALIASGFRERPKVVLNHARAVAVGSVCGIYTDTARRAQSIVKQLRRTAYSDRVVAHSNGLRKLEINQINALIGELDGNS